MGRGLEALFKALASLKLAVVVVLLLAAALAAGTILESVYDTKTSQYYVYRAFWFHAVLAALGVNIFAVMVDRWPWKPRHLPFLLAHIGILILLAGSWVTDRFGLDGALRVREGETASIVELDNASLVLTEPDQVRKVPVRWLPPHVSFAPIRTQDHGITHDLTIDQFLAHADPIYNFIPNPTPNPERPEWAAAKIKIEGGAMRITQELWLWAGDESFRNVSMGPAVFSIGSDAPKPVEGRPNLALVAEKDGSLSFTAHGSDGKQARGRFPAKSAAGKTIEPGWKGGVKITVLDWIPNAAPLVSYQKARIQYGPMAPPSAIHVISGKGGEGAETWLGLGDRAVLHTEKGNVEIGYLPQRVVLPFSVRLDRFSIERYEGSMDPSSYSSRVSVTGADEQLPKNASGEHEATISMNEPLTVKGITLYQASYEDAQPRPVVSIFTVNRDPGRGMKYWGSILIVLGSILLFAVKYRKHKKTQAMKAPSAAPAPAGAATPSEVS